MAEAVYRPHKHRVNRWMPKQKRAIPWQHIQGAARFMVKALPGYLLSFAEVLGIPSGFHAAFAMALAASKQDVRPTLAGSAVAFLVRLISGLPPRWEMLITLAVMAAAPLLPCGRSTFLLMGATVVAVLPTAIVASLSVTAAETLQGWAMVALAALSAPVMARAVRLLTGGRHISAMEERVAVGYLAAILICGGARMLLLGVNIGVLISAAGVLAMAMILGVGAGAVAGMLAGVMLALQGLPLVLSVALSLGGFLAGMASSLGKRRLSCGAFAMGAYLPLLLCGATGVGCGASVLAAALVLAVLPRGAFEGVQQFLRRFLANDPVPGDAYAASALTAWEHTVAAMAQAVPSPRDADTPRDGAWWQAHLCQGCPECGDCGCLTTELGISKAETVWEYRCADEQVWQSALDNLRGMGCHRLYFLLDAMNALRREDEAARRVIHQAEAQRDMLVTHLTAMSGAARRFAALSSGESWWDDMAARRIRKELAERAEPATLSFVRRVQGHAQAAFELHFITGVRKQAEELCRLSTAVLEAPMQLANVDGDRVLLTEIPLLRAEVGVAAQAITGGEVCGDTAWSGMLADGRFLAALSDGMGHGERAALSSRQTVELLRLCLDAGYTRQQTLTAVNGMMLLGGGGERFATADVLTIDLWKGTAALDKLGAAASWVYQQGMLSRIAGDALPLGIIETIDQSGSSLRLDAGDAVILLTDGVEDAFRSRQALEDALLAALACESPAKAAEALLEAALAADSGERRDDQSAVFVYISSSARQQEAL
ncbi:MAG: SpoIIE family protein phosphatase [Aristaeellaceae bacterium]